MNRRRQSSNFSIPTLIVLFVAGIIVSAGGVSYVMVKNKQVTLRRQIDKTQKRMIEHNVAIDLHHSDIEQALGVLDLGEKYDRPGSGLKKVHAGVVEVLETEADSLPADHAVAQRQ